MEFDIVELGNGEDADINGIRLSMTFDIVELGNGKRHCDVSTVDGVRHC